LLAALVESGRWPEALAAAREAEDVHPLGKYLKSEVSERQTAHGELRTALTTENTESTEDGNGTSRSGVHGRLRTAPTAEGDSTLSLGEGAEHADGKPRDTGKPTLKPQAPSLKPAARIRVPDDPEVRAALYEERDFIANCARAHLENDLLDAAEARYLLHVQLCPNEVKGYNGLAERGPARGTGSGSGRLRSPPAVSASIDVSGGYACFGVLAGNELARPLSDDRSPRQGQALRA
jgi:hypothetical protein